MSRGKMGGETTGGHMTGDETTTSTPAASGGSAPGAGGGSGGHARHRLDEVIHAPVRFSIVAALAGVDYADFATIRDAVEVTDSTLSKQASVLEKAGYVKVSKGYVGKRPRTWLSLTRDGRKAYESHLAALRAIAGG
ncbi:transcriptional regulator [Dietzia maris]|uniref:winged helix-turn-helix domain-containing protein n=1 Tax=Dietzia TaxID=37914 RepID=UPI001FC9EC6E|nr:transcriptional regulator [Dietzia kunjamensis]